MSPAYSASSRAGKARILFSQPAELSEPPDFDYPFLLLLTGRGTSSQWHTQSRTGKSDILCKLYPATAYAEIHPQDAEKYHLKNGANVTIRSRRG